MTTAVVLMESSQPNSFLDYTTWDASFGRSFWRKLATCATRRKPMILQLLLLLLIAGICGALGQAIGGYTHGGCLVSIALGFIGAMLGSWIAGRLGLPELLAIPAG